MGRVTPLRLEQTIAGLDGRLGALSLAPHEERNEVWWATVDSALETRFGLAPVDHPARFEMEAKECAELEKEVAS